MVSRPTIGKYETGVAYPDFEKLVALSNLFNCSTDYLLGLVDNPKKVSSNEINFLDGIMSLAVSEGILQNDRPLNKADYQKLIEDIKTSYIAIKLLKRLNQGK